MRYLIYYDARWINKLAPGGWPILAAPLKTLRHSFACFAKEPALSLSKGWELAPRTPPGLP
jgi:hypothetical protein